ncbi:MAG: class I SAM-dependent methyltransferase [Planctomycetota bacterium]|jgi:hypothetical protein
MSDGKGQLEIGLEAFAGLLDEFRSGTTTNRRLEPRALEHHLRELSRRWDESLPGLPRERYPYASMIGVYRRGVRDEYLKKIIEKLLKAAGPETAGKTIVNPACVFGRHARNLASQLGHFEVIATDIDWRFNWLYERVAWRKDPGNYRFVQDDIFDPRLTAEPTAVVFFGACGSVSDGAIDYAIETDCPHLICRTCCHDNIGGNTTITKRFNILNWAFRLKNLVYAKRREKGRGDYFSDKYTRDRYPQSRAARGLSNSDEFIEISRNSVDSDVCRSIIDLDRYLHLVESGYDVLYRAELFVARKNR